MTYGDLIGAIKDRLVSETDYSDLISITRHLKTIALIEEKSSDNCTRIICKYLTNIRENPDENRYRCIWIDNKVMQSQVLVFSCASHVLELIGFKVSDDNQFYMFQQSHLEPIAKNIEIISSTQPISWKCDRNAIIKSAGQFESDMRTLQSQLKNSNGEAVTKRALMQMIKLSEERKTLGSALVKSEQSKNFSNAPRTTKIIVKFTDSDSQHQQQHLKYFIADFETNESIKAIIQELCENLKLEAGKFSLNYSGVNLSELPQSTKIVEARLYPRILIDLVKK